MSTPRVSILRSSRDGSSSGHGSSASSRRRSGSIFEDLEDNPDLDDSMLITRMHEIIDGWSVEVARSLQLGEVDGLTLDRQMIIEGLLNIIDALDQESDPDDNLFEQNEQGGEQQGSSGPQSGQETPLVPPIAELKLLRNMQDMVYSRTRRLSEVIGPDSMISNGSGPPSRRSAPCG